MRIKVMLLLAVVAALGLIAPAHAEDFVGHCQEDPYVCVGIIQFEEGTASGTFVIAETDGAGLFAGTESDSDQAYQAVGACGGALVTGVCAVAFTHSGHNYVYLESDAGCETIALDGGDVDWC